ncbi:MAG: Spy/CpxP family protein refolding chaperone [Vicinamibacterales bacterium]
MTTYTKRFGLWAGAALVALSVGSTFVHAQNTSGRPGPFMGRGGPAGRGGPGAFGPMLLRRLNLTEAQREQVKSALDSHRDEMRALADKAFEARKGLRAAIAADSFDESAVRARSAEVATIEADMAVLQARVHQEVWQLLTPEQQKQAKELQARMDERRGGRRGQR